MSEQNGLIRETMVDLHHRLRVAAFRYFTLPTADRVTGFPPLQEAVFEALERMGDNLGAVESYLREVEQQIGPTGAAGGPIVD